MKIVFLNGGLANQAFQYLFFRYAELTDSSEEWLLDDSFFFTNEVHNGYELDRVFGVRPRLISEHFDRDVWEYMIGLKKRGKSIPQIFLDNGEEIVKVLEANYSSNWNPFSGEIRILDEADKTNPNIVYLPGNIYYHGYWIDKFWMRELEKLGENLVFPEITDSENLLTLKHIEETNSTSIHIRRGDYADLGLTAENSVIRNMVDLMREKQPDLSLFVFSDDIEWCRNNEESIGFSKCRELFYVSNNSGTDSYRDMQLMSKCKNMILSNSAFCYLAALLNKELKLVLNPNRNRPL